MVKIIHWTACNLIRAVSYPVTIFVILIVFRLVGHIWCLSDIWVTDFMTLPLNPKTVLTVIWLTDHFQHSEGSRSG